MGSNPSNSTENSHRDEEQGTPPTHHTDSLETSIRHRHSIRVYKPDPVPEDLLQESLKLAQLAPSNSNIQNWRLYIASGAARNRIVTALKTAASQGPPQIPPLPDNFKHHRSELGHHLYGAEGYGIPRSDKQAAHEARMRNFEFFGAPTVAVIAMDRSLGFVDAMSVGMFVQTLMLALTERGLGTCLEVSVAGYEGVLREQFGVSEELVILCGMPIGFPAPEAKVNKMIVGRDDLERQVTFLIE